MINKESFRDNMKYYDKGIVLQVIDIFLNEYPDRLQELEKNVMELDFHAIDNNAHSYKGVVTYMSGEMAELARKLEFMGKESNSNGIHEALAELTSASLELAVDLKEIRGEYE